MENLMTTTEQLLIYLNKLKTNYETGIVPEKDKEFFNFVKKETDPMFDLLHVWEEAALSHIKKQNVSLHPKQIDATIDNIKTLILHSYYIDVRKRRYMEIYKSCEYILNLLLKEE